MPRHDISKLGGVMPALLTPFDRDGALDLDRLRKLTAHLKGTGVTGFYLTGSTGESFMMTPDERKRVVETVVDEVNGDLPVIVHVGAISSYHSVDLARHAAAAGADAVSSVPPIYWPFTADQIEHYYADIIAATDLPMIVYNVALASIGYETLLRLSQMENVAGVKYTATTHFDIMRLREAMGPEFRIYSGADEMAVSGMASGSDGLIGSFYNPIPEVFISLYEAMQAGEIEEAKRLQAIGNAVVFETLATGAALGVMKRMMAWRGADAGFARSPHVNIMDDAEEAALKERFRKLKAERGLTGSPLFDAL